MKLLVLLCFVLAASEINAYVAEVNDIEKLTQKINEYITECVEEGEFEITTDDIAGKFSDEQKNLDVEIEGMKQGTRCIFHKAGILAPNGKLNTDAAMLILTLFIGVEGDDAEELLQKCTSITGFDAKDTAFLIFKCFEDSVMS